MLKTISYDSGHNCGYYKTKCAEIHYQSRNFMIVCIFCGERNVDYNEFVEHFHLQHLTNLAKYGQSTFEVNQPAKSNDRNDPLQIEEISEFPEIEPIKRIINENEMTVKEELTEIDGISTNKLKNPLSHVEKDHCDEPECGSSDICKIKLEQSETSTIEGKQQKRAIVCSAEEEDQICGNNDTSSDWTHSFTPTLLKLHEKRPYKPRHQPNVCGYCGRTFRRRYQLDTHLNIHTGLKPHQCDVCGRQFRAITTLSRHLTTHERRETFSCKYCAKQFTHRAALVSHEMRHTQERRVPCDECDKLFYTLNQMDTHKRKVHHKCDDSTLPFACDLCPKRYRSASMLSTHKFKKHYKMAKHLCEQCDKKFVDQQQLENHKLIHVKN